MLRRSFPLLLLAALLTAGPALAQDSRSSDPQVVQAATQAARATIHAVVDMLRGLSTSHLAPSISTPFSRLADELGPGVLPLDGPDNLGDPDDLDDLQATLREIRAALAGLERQLRDNGDRDLAQTVVDIQSRVDEASRSVRALQSEGDMPTSEWLEPGDYQEGRRVPRAAENDRGQRREENRWRDRGDDDREEDDREEDDREVAHEDDWEGDDDEPSDHSDWWSRRDERRRDGRASDWRHRRSDSWSYAPAFIGDLSERWPFGETGLYRPSPIVRYNRVDGFVLGVRRLPLDWDSYDRLRVYGQGGYAFALDEWRYEIGGEARLGRPYRDEPFDIKIGASYRRETGTNDAWKAPWLENSIAAFFVHTDFYDYFETEGYSVYAAVRLSPLAQITAAYRADEYSSLRRETTWSMFGSNDFRLNPAIDEGRMQSVVLALDGGRLRGFRSDPNGVALRAEVELGRDFGGDFDFNRYTGDVRAYARTGRDSGLRLRLRGSTSTGDIPIQKRYTIGGAGSVRAYPQNAFVGSRMLLANAEFSLYEVSLFDDLFDGIAVFGLFDAGWTDTPTEKAFDAADMLTAAGFGVGFGDGSARLELAWPLKNVGTGMEPTLWLRLSPIF